MKVTIKNAVPESVLFSDVKRGQYYIKSLVSTSILMRISDNVLKDYRQMENPAYHNCVFIGGESHGIMNKTFDHERVWLVDVDIVASVII